MLVFTQQQREQCRELTIPNVTPLPPASDTYELESKNCLFCQKGRRQGDPNFLAISLMDSGAKLAFAH